MLEPCLLQPCFHVAGYDPHSLGPPQFPLDNYSRKPWLRTNGVNTNGAAAKVMNFDWEGRFTGVPNKSLCQNARNSL